jgi:hypothetical protein
MGSIMPVDTPRADYSAMLPKWQRLRDCFDGRDAILARGPVYAPDLPGADKAANLAYRLRGNFYNATSRTVGGMNGMIFQESPNVTIPESESALLDDITLTNVSFESFSTMVGSEIFTMGRYGALIDMPTQPTEAGALQRPDVDMRPYAIAYRAEDIVNWRTERRGGDQVLTMVVLREIVEIQDAEDAFKLKQICQYRVVMLNGTLCVVQLWRESTEESKEYRKFSETTLMRRGEALSFVPFVFFGPLSPSPDLAAPPLIDLADVNLGHWRNSVDYEHGLHLVALPTPWQAGGKGGPDDGPKKMGPSVVWELEVNGSAGMLEFTGAGLDAIAAAMEEKKKQMATLGARLLEDAPTVGETASAVKLRHSGETASLKTIAQSLEEGLVQMLQICLWWQTTEAKPADVEAEVELNKEYLNVRATPQEIQVALTALQAGEMSFETWWNLLTTGGWAREGVDADQEQKDIAKRKVDVTPPDPNLDPNLNPNPVPPQR